ncbi:MAG: class II aldolase/adducin family protein [Acidimicrobiales bacterium]|nr:class II aldolase/adducin family protein [Acidimicrobiales bacterium]
MSFQPTPDALLPEMSPELELVLLARTLWREGYDDHLAGHITYRQPDGSFLTNPWFLLWDEFGVDDVVRIDIDGRVLEGRLPPAPGVKLHLEVHKLRSDVGVAVHNHPRFATLWANARRLPPCLDQTSGLGGGVLALVDEYDGTVADQDHAITAAINIGTADIALLAGHGLFVTGDDLAEAHLRCVAFEQRCRVAYQVEELGGGRALAADVQDTLGRAKFDGFWEAMARRELRLDPSLLPA